MGLLWSRERFGVFQPPNGERVGVVGQDRPLSPDLPALVTFPAAAVQSVAAFEGCANSERQLREPTHSTSGHFASVRKVTLTERRHQPRGPASREGGSRVAATALCEGEKVRPYPGAFCDKLLEWTIKAIKTSGAVISANSTAASKRPSFTGG